MKPRKLVTKQQLKNIMTKNIFYDTMSKKKRKTGY